MEAALVKGKGRDERTLVGRGCGAVGATRQRGQPAATSMRVGRVLMALRDYNVYPQSPAGVILKGVGGVWKDGTVGWV